MSASSIISGFQDRTATANHSLRIGVFMRSFAGGGIEQLYAKLSAHWRRAGHKVDFLVNAAAGPSRAFLGPGTSITELRADKPARSVGELVAYVRAHRPDILLSGHDHANLTLCAVSLLARQTGTRVVVGQHSSLLSNRSARLKDRIVPALYRLLLGRANQVFAVSAGVAHELEDSLGWPQDRIRVILNGVVPEDLKKHLEDEEAAAFFSALPTGPVVLGMGRLTEVKDFATLLRAFAMLRKQLGTEASLVILGEGPERNHLLRLAAELGISEAVMLPGFRSNPFAYLSRASVFALASRFEGFGNVLAEALACGTPVIATDCPVGPREILDGGRFGTLVPVGDAAAMAEAIRTSLRLPVDRRALRQRGLEFGEARCAQAYIEMFEAALGGADRNEPA